MNRRGFTLVEGLTVIAIIGVLLLVLIPSVITIINKNKEKACESIKSSVISATKMYVAENKYDLNFGCGVAKNILLSTLDDAGKLSGVPLDYPSSVSVIYDCSSNEFAYTYNVDCKNR